MTKATELRELASLTTIASGQIQFDTDVMISGDLLTSGNTITISADELNIEDKNITLASGSANSAVADGAGITIDGADATLNYYSSGDEWQTNKPLRVATADSSSVMIQNTTNTGQAKLIFVDEGGNEQSSLRYSMPGNTTHLDFNGNGFELYSNQIDSTIAKFGINAPGYSDSYFNGKVGIGDSNPSFPLDVSYASGGRVRFKASTGHSILELSSIAGHDWFIESKSDGEFHIVDDDAASDRFLIDVDGNTGIGNISPEHKLDVDGDINARESFRTDQVRHSIRPTLNLDFANTKELDSRITFYRDSIATYYDSKGILRYANTNTPRFDHDPVTGESKGLLIEEARTNILTHSNALPLTDSSYWISRGMTLESGLQAPDGTMSAIRVTENDTSSNAGYVLIGDTSNGNTQTFSVWLKADTPSTVLISCTGSVVGDYVNLTTEWQRFETTDNFNSGSGPHVGGFNTITRGSGQSFYIWGPQLEYGAFPTSYVPSDTRFISRSSVATYHDENGILRTAPANSPRYGYKYDGRKWVETRLILENSATNLTTNSHQPDIYAKNGVTSSEVVCPDGVTRNALFTPTTSNAQHFITRFWNATSGQTSCMSFYAKDFGVGVVSYHLATSAFTGGSIYFNFDSESITLNGDMLDGGFEKLADGWYRIWGVATPDATANDAFYIGIPDLGSYTGNGTDGVAIWGLQAEAGYYPSSYIYTLGTTTRSADVASSSAYTRDSDKAEIVREKELDFYNEDAGTLYYEASSNHLSNDTGGGRLGFSYDGSNDDRWMVNINSTSYDAYIQANGQTSVNISGTAPGVGVMHKAAIAATSNDAAVYQNGSLEGTDSSVVMPKINQFRLYNPTTVDEFICGHFKKIAYYPERLSNAELQALTEND